MRVKMIRLSTWLFTVLLLCSALLAPAAAADVEDSVQTVRIGCSISTGYHCMGEDGGIYGYGYDLEQLIAKYAGWNIEYVEGSWTELTDMLESGEIDTVGFLIPSAARLEKFDFADMPAGYSTSCLITGASNQKYAYEDYQAFDGMTVSCQKNNANIKNFQAWCQENGFTVKLDPCESYQDVFDAIDDGAADAGLVTNYADISGYNVVARFLPKSFYYAVKKGNTALLTQINAAFDQINIFYPNYASSIYERNFQIDNGRGVVFTQEELAYLATKPVVSVIPGGRREPFEYIGQGTETYCGIVPDVLKKITELTGIQFRYDTQADRWGFAYDKSMGNAITTITCDLDWVREKNLDCTQSYLNCKISMLAKENGAAMEKIAYSTDGYPYMKISQLYPEWELAKYDTVDQCLDAVISGECDGAVMNDHIADYYLNMGKYHTLYETLSNEINQEIGFGVSYSSDPVLCDVLSKSLLMISDETYTNIVRQNVKQGKESGIADLVYTNPVQFTVAVTIVSLLAVTSLMLAIYVVSIRKKNRVILETTHAKTDFFARMSHDMRTPMNGILGMVALSKDETDTAVLHQNLDKIEDSGKYMLGLINDTLDMQKIEAGKLKIEPQVVHCGKFIDNLSDMMRANAEQNGIDYRVDNCNIDLDRYAKIDSLRLKQIFANLLSNAIKFTPRGGCVHFSLECLRTEGNIEHDRFRVADTGIGISKEFLNGDLFTPYAQENNSMTTKYAGSGLGLAITKSLVELMGGQIQIESEQDEGTCVTVYLDIEIVDKAAVEAEASKKQEHVIESRGKLNGRHILLCEDHPLNAEIATRLLKKAGCIVHHEENGRAGVEAFYVSQLHEYDAVLMDIRMPEMDGLEATRRIRALEREDARTTPIIAMTANAYEEDREASRKAGMNAHLAKPIVPQLMYDTIEREITAAQIQ